MKIVFICTGNTCRSPMAAEIAKNIALKKWRNDLKFSSVGLSAFSGDSAAASAIEALKENGLDLSGHSARALNQYIADETDLFVPMTSGHRNILLSLGIAEDKIKNLSCEIPDPFGQNIDAYRACRDKLEECIGELIDELH